MSPRVTPGLEALRKAVGGDGLSPRETEIVRLIALGRRERRGRRQSRACPRRTVWETPTRSGLPSSSRRPPTRAELVLIQRTTTPLLIKDC